MANKTTLANRLRQQRKKWQQQVSIVEGYWADCSPEDLDEMRIELQRHIAILLPRIGASDVDDASKLALRMRLDVLLREVTMRAHDSTETGEVI